MRKRPPIHTAHRHVQSMGIELGSLETYDSFYLFSKIERRGGILILIHLYINLSPFEDYTFLRMLRYIGSLYYLYCLGKHFSWPNCAESLFPNLIT